MQKCQGCQNSIAEDECIEINDFILCIRCKHTYIQKLREGVNDDQAGNVYKASKSIKTHLQEIFFRQSFIDSKTKIKDMKETFISDLKLFVGLFVFGLIVIGIIALFA